MSISFRQIRKNSTAQGRFKDLVSDYQRFVAEQNTVDNPDFKVKLRTMYSKLVYRDPFVSTKTKSVNTVFYMPFEPDAQYCVGMWNLNHNGHFSVDSSGKGHFGRWQQNPEVKEGIDDGFGTTLYADFNGERTYVYVDNFPKLQLSAAPKFTITCRIYPTDISASDGPGGTMYRTILNKSDTSIANGSQSGFIDSGSVGNGYSLAVAPDGRVIFTIVVAGVKYTAQTLPNVIVPFDPPFPYDITVTCDQINKRTIPAHQVLDPGEVPGAGEEEEAETTPPLVAPRMEISVNGLYYALYTTGHLHMVDDSNRIRLRIGTTFGYAITNTRYLWFKWKGGIQQVRIYNGIVLSFRQLENMRNNRLTITEMPIGSVALAGSVLILPPNPTVGYDITAYDEIGFESGALESLPMGFPGMDPNGFDEDGFDVLTLSEQGALQEGGFDPRGISNIGFDTTPFSHS